MLTGGCKKETAQPAQAALSLNPSSTITYEAVGGTTLIAVTTNQDKWKAVSDQDWCKVNELDDTTFTLTTKANECSEPMPEATVTITAGTGNNTKTVILKANQKRGESVQSQPLTIDITDVTATSATMTVVPLHNDAT